MFRVRIDMQTEMYIDMWVDMVSHAAIGHAAIGHAATEMWMDMVEKFSSPEARASASSKIVFMIIY